VEFWVGIANKAGEITLRASCACLVSFAPTWESDGLERRWGSYVALAYVALGFLDFFACVPRVLVFSYRHILENQGCLQVEGSVPQFLRKHPRN